MIFVVNRQDFYVCNENMSENHCEYSAYRFNKTLFYFKALGVYFREARHKGEDKYGLSLIFWNRDSVNYVNIYVALGMVFDLIFDSNLVN